MKCENIQSNLSVYLDDILTENERAAVERHLARCPLCRAKSADYQTLRRDLRSLESAPMPADVLASVRNSVSREVEIERRGEHENVFSESFRRWLLMRLMPYGAATVLSLTFGTTLLWSLLSNADTRENNIEIARVQAFDKTAILLPRRNSASDSDEVELTAADYAAARRDVSGDSPSLNPNGALLALTKSFARGKTKGDEVVVVADVFGSGLARVAEVIEPSSDRRAVRRLEKALRNNDDGDYAPFVTALTDKRPETVRVVLRINRVDIHTGK